MWGRVAQRHWWISHVRRTVMEGVNYKRNRVEGYRDFTMSAAFL